MSMNYTPTISDYRGRLADLLGHIARDYPNQAMAIIGPELANFPEFGGAGAGIGSASAGQGLFAGGLPSLGLGKKRRGPSSKQSGTKKKKKIRVRRDDEGLYVESDEEDGGDYGEESIQQDGLSMDGSLSMDMVRPALDPAARALRSVFGV